MPSKLDNLTWEIFHTIFDYLKTSDLFDAFVNLNPYINNILNSYLRIHLNFKSIKKCKFYFICEHIHPDQIQSLVLSDDKYTPGQIKLFMSLLPLIKCINLRHISIDHIYDVDLFCLIISHLENNVQLRSLSINSDSIQLNKKNSRSFTEVLTTLTSLKQLKFINSSSLITLRQPLSKLTHLTISSCNFNDLGSLFRLVPNLIYLKIFVPFNEDTFKCDHVLPHLSSLIIESQRWISFAQLENLFSFTPSVNHLTLETTSDPSLLDGQQWETLIKTKLPHLTECVLNITPEENDLTADGVLQHFQNSFWTVEKHCHMACLISTITQTCARLFSVPQFSQTEDWYPSSEGFTNYSLNNYLFHQDCTSLRVTYFPSELPVPSPYKHIHTLSLECTTDNINQIQQFLDLKSVNHLKIESSVQCKPLNDLLQSAPNIYQLTIGRNTLLQIIDLPPDHQNVYKQIKMLNVADILLREDTDRICSIFPKLEYISLSVKEQNDMISIFNGLHYLIGAIIHLTNPSLSVIGEYLQENGICTDDTYRLHESSVQIWID